MGRAAASSSSRSPPRSSAGRPRPSSGWLATVLAVPGLGFPSPSGRLPTAVAVPRSRRRGRRPRVAVDDDGRLTGTVPRVLAGAEAASFVVAVGAARRAAAATSSTPARPGVSVTARPLLDRSRGRWPTWRFDGPPRDPARGGRRRGVWPRAADLAAVLVAADSLGRDRADARAGGGVQQAAPPVRRADRLVPGGQARRGDDRWSSVEAARSAVYFAAASVEAGHPTCALHAAAVKAQVTAEGAARPRTPR